MAGSRDIRIGVKIDGIDQTRQDFAAIGAAVKALGPEGEAAAQEITAGLGKIEASSARVAAGIERDGKVSQSALDKLIADFGRTRDAVERAFPEGAPDALSAALEKSYDRIAAVVKAADALPSALETARQAFRGLGTTIQETAKAADPLADLPQAIAQGFKATAGALADFEKKFQETGDVGPGELEKIIKSQERLRIAIERSGMSLDELGPEARRAFDTIDREAGQATQIVQRLETAVDRNKVAAASLAQGWGGLGNAVQQSMGKHGDAVVQFSIIKAGLDSIRDAIQKTEASMGSAQLGSATLSQAYGIVQTRVTDVAVAVQKAAQDIAAAADLLGRTPPNAESVMTFYDEYNTAVDKVGVSLFSGKDGLEAYQVALDAGLPRVEAMYLANSRHNQVLEIQRQALAEGRDGFLLWREALLNSGGTAEGLVAQLEKLQGTLTVIAGTTDEVKAAADRVTASWKAHKAEIAEVEKQQNKQIEATAKQVEQQLELHTAMNGLTAPLQHYLDWLGYAVPNVDNLTKAWGINVAKAQESLDSAVGLTKEERTRYQGLIDLAKQVKDLDADERRLLKSQLESAAATKEVHENTYRWTNDSAKFTTAVDTAAGGYGRLAAGVKQTNDELDIFMSKADRAAEKLRALQEATSSATGASGGAAPTLTGPGLAPAGPSSGGPSINVPPPTKK